MSARRQRRFQARSATPLARHGMGSHAGQYPVAAQSRSAELTGNPNPVRREPPRDANQPIFTAVPLTATIIMPLVSPSTA